MTIACPDRPSWQQLVDGTLPEAQQAELTAHLDRCAACRSVVDGLSTVGGSMVGMAGRLRQPVPPAETALQNVINDIKSSTHTEETQAEPARARDDDLAFLAPPAQSGHLGRLAHYEVHEVIGKGGFGIVLKAFDEKLHRVVAIKVLSPSLAASGSARKRFIREARAVAAIAHEHIVGIYAVDEDHNPPYFVMQCVSGMSLQEKLDKRGPLEVNEILRIGMQMAEGLAAAHKIGKIHRDIKPANILLENGVERVKITDFGLARTLDDASVTQSGVIAGTPMYMSPEQAEGHNVDHRTDLFSLGTVLYVMCTGRPPFRATGTMAVMKRVIEDTPTPVREVNPEIPEWLADIIAKLHAKKPEERFQSAKEVAELLGQHLADVQAGCEVRRAEGRKAPGEAPASKIGTMPPPAAPPQRRWLRKAALAVLASVAIAVAVAALTYFLRPHTYAITLEKDDPDVIVRIWSTAQSDAPINLAGSVEILGEPLRTIRGPHLTTEIRLPAGHYWLIAELNGREVHRVFMKLQRNEFVTHYHEKIGQMDNWVGKTDVGIPNVVFIPGAANYRQLEKAKLRGDWRAIAAEQDGKPLPKDMVEKVNLRLRFGVNDVQLEMAETAQSKRTEKRGPFLFDSLKKPATLDIEDVFEGKRLLAIYRWDGDKLILCGSAPGQHERPTEFATWSGDKRMLFVLVRDKAGSSTEKNDEADWVQLVNGKDLAGWHRGKEASGTWKVENGNLVGKGHQAWLLSDRKDFKDFHLRMKAKYVNGMAHLILRGNGERSNAGYFVYLNNGKGDFNTGAITTAVDFKSYNAPVRKELTKPGEWFDLEIIARGKHFQTFVNGAKALDWTDPAPKNVTQGELRLDLLGKDVELHIKSIKIKELPSEDSGWTRLFNGKDLDGWVPVHRKSDMGTPWDIVDGVLIPKGPAPGYLRTAKKYRDFELSLEYRLAARDQGLYGAVLWEVGGQDGEPATRPDSMRLEVSRQFNGDPVAMMFSSGPREPKSPAFHVKCGPTGADPWNRLELTCKDGAVELRINGVASKTTHQAFEGYLALQSIGTGIHFRNVKIKEVRQ